MFCVQNGNHQMKKADLFALVLASSEGHRLRLSMSDLFLKIFHMIGLIQAKVVKDRKPALSRGWELDTETSTNKRSALDKICHVMYVIHDTNFGEEQREGLNF